MLEITLSPEALTRFRTLLREEDNEDAVFRIREVKCGCACKSHMELRLGIDEREAPEEEEETVVEGMPFVINKDVIDVYGRRYDISLDGNGLPRIRTLDT